MQIIFNKIKNNLEQVIKTYCPTLSASENETV